MGVFEKQTDSIYFDQILKQAYEILEKADLNSERENLKKVLKNIAKWTEDGGDDEKYFEEFNKFIISMVALNFSAQLPICEEAKSVQNVFSLGLNMVNEELKERVISKQLVLLLLQELNLKNCLVIGTDPEGSINFLYTDKEGRFPVFDSIKGQNIKAIISNLDEVSSSIAKHGIGNGMEITLTIGNVGPVLLKIAKTSWLQGSEGSMYIFQLPE